MRFFFPLLIERVDHLALMMELLGKIPRKVLNGGRLTKAFFTKQGDLKNITKLGRLSLFCYPLIVCLGSKLHSSIFLLFSSLFRIAPLDFFTKPDHTGLFLSILPFSCLFSWPLSVLSCAKSCCQLPFMCLLFSILTNARLLSISVLHSFVCSLCCLHPV